MKIKFASLVLFSICLSVTASANSHNAGAPIPAFSLADFDVFGPVPLSASGTDVDFVELKGSQISDVKTAINSAISSQLFNCRTYPDGSSFVSNKTQLEKISLDEWSTVYSSAKGLPTILVVQKFVTVRGTLGASTILYTLDASRLRLSSFRTSVFTPHSAHKANVGTIDAPKYTVIPAGWGSSEIGYQCIAGL